jgi:hypothetical protein
MTESKRKTKRKVYLVSSHSERDSENGPPAAYSLEGSAVSELYNNDIPRFLKYHAKEGEQLIEREKYGETLWLTHALMSLAEHLLRQMVIR